MVDNRVSTISTLSTRPGGHLEVESALLMKGSVGPFDIRGWPRVFEAYSWASRASINPATLLYNIAVCVSILLGAVLVLQVGTRLLRRQPRVEPDPQAGDTA